MKDSTHQLLQGRNEAYRLLNLNNPLTKSGWLEKPHVTCFASGIESSFLNSAWLSSSSPLEESLIDESQAFFQRKQLPFFWWGSPVTDKQALQMPEKELFERKGFDLAGTIKGVWKTLNDPLPLQKQERIRIMELENFPLFLDILTEAFGFNPLIANQFEQAMKEGIKTNKMVNYLAYHDQKPVAALTAIKTDQTISLWNAATLKPYRNQGLGASLVCHALKQAQQAEYQQAVVFLTQETKLWSKLGFKFVCDFPFYLLNRYSPLFTN